MTLVNVLADTVAALEALQALQAAVRKHRDQRGDDRCFLDDYELYATLPEGLTPEMQDRLRLHEPEVMLANCKRYIAARHDPLFTYVSPEREREALEARIRALEAQLAAVGQTPGGGSRVG